MPRIKEKGLKRREKQEIGKKKKSGKK